MKTKLIKAIARVDKDFRYVVTQKNKFRGVCKVFGDFVRASVALSKGCQVAGLTGMCKHPTMCRDPHTKLLTHTAVFLSDPGNEPWSPEQDVKWLTTLPCVCVDQCSILLKYNCKYLFSCIVQVHCSYVDTN